jgi:hypothetical protein
VGATLVVLGIVGMLVAAVLLFLDCERDYGATAGGETTFSSLWTVGTLALGGGMVLCGSDWLWVCVVVALGLGGSFPVRSAVGWAGKLWGVRN